MKQIQLKPKAEVQKTIACGILELFSKQISHTQDYYVKIFYFA